VWAEDGEGGVSAIGTILEARDEALELDEPEVDEVGGKVKECDGARLDLESSERNADRREVGAGLWVGLVDEGGMGFNNELGKARSDVVDIF
jgi:hypothetical protein